MSSIKNNLTSAKIQQLLAAVGSAPTEDSSQIETQEYDWSVPHYFNDVQLKKLSDFTEQLARTVAEQFGNFCRSQFEVTIESTDQRFGDEFLNESTDDKEINFYLPFGANQENHSGLLVFPEKTAVSWIKQLLGDNDSEDNAERKFSQLEKSLLLDLASTLIKSFSSLCSSNNIQPARNIESGQCPLNIPGTEVLCRISLNIKKTDTENNTTAYFLIPCSELEPALGKTTKTKNEQTSEDISKMIFGHLEKTSINVTVQLASVELSFEEMMDLQVNDIVLLDKKIDEPVELIVEERTVCYGWPVQSAGKYAVTISETAF